MYKSELVERICKQEGVTAKECNVYTDLIFGEIEKAVQAGEEVHLLGFGTFYRKESAARKGFNPSTKEPIEIPARKSLGFKPSKAMKNI